MKKMVHVLKAFLFFSFILSAFYAARVPQQQISVESLGNFAVDLELAKSLAEHLKDLSVGPLKGQLFKLMQALENFENAFYRKEVLSRYCDDPKDKNKTSDILAAAFRKDLDNPFSEGYNLNLLPLGEVDAGLAEVNTLTNLKLLGRLEEVIHLIKIGRLHFKSDFKLGYVASVKAHVRKFIVAKARDAFREVVIQQIGYNLDFSNFFGDEYVISPQGIGHVGYMTIGTAKAIMIYLPYIKITHKKYTIR